MNQLVEQNLSNLIQELTTSGSKILNEEKMKRLKQICKQTDVNVEYCYRLLIAQLNKQHAEIRYSTFQIIDQLFQRSHHFRTLLLDDFNYLIDKCLGLNIDDQLPPPKPTAKLLKQFTATCIKTWHEKFGSTYKLLDIGFNYLKNCKFLNFDNVDQPIGITAELERERNEANQVRLAQKLQTATQELTDTSNEIYSCIKQAENCLNLLVANNDKTTVTTVTEESPEDDVDDDSDDDDDDDDFIEVPLEPTKNNDQELLQVLGLTTAGKATITINLNEPPKKSLFDVEMTDDNRALVENLHDLYRQLDDLYLNKIQSWMNIFIRADENPNQQQTTTATTVMKKAIDLKNSIRSCLKMIENYHLAPKKTPKKTEKSSLVIPKPKVTETQSPSIETTSVPTLTEAEIRYYFDNDTDSIKRSFKQNDVQNAFVRPSESNEMPDNLNYSLLMRKRTFVTELPTIKWKCRAPLGNGKLCERMDRYKCPFHGRIIARNEQGLPEDDRIRFQEEEEERAKKRAIPDWQDPQMLEDIRLATGIDLRMSEANKRKKSKKKESNLTELGVEEDSARVRLEKKIFNRSSLKRIGAALDADERRRNEEKFHHQFNYSLNG